MNVANPKCFSQHWSSFQLRRQNTFMMTSSNGNIFRVTGPLCREFGGHRWIPSKRSVTRSFDVFFHLCLNKRLGKQSWGWWFETILRLLWRHCNVLGPLTLFIYQTPKTTYSVDIYDIRVLLACKWRRASWICHVKSRIGLYCIYV